MSAGLSADAIIEIQNLQARYAQVVTAGDVEGFVDLFSEDAVWERVQPAAGTKYGEQVVHSGISAIRDNAVNRFPAPFEVQYISTNSSVWLESHSVKGSAVILLLEMDAGKPVVSAVANVSDIYIESDTGWKISSRQLRFLQ